MYSPVVSWYLVKPVGIGLSVYTGLKLVKTRRRIKHVWCITKLIFQKGGETMIAIQHYGPLFARLRREKQIKASTIARQIGISEATYSQIETGRRSVSLERVSRICLELGLSTVDFVKLWQKQAVIRRKTKRTGRQ